MEGFDTLTELALDMSWSWNHATDEVWRQHDPVLRKPANIIEAQQALYYRAKCNQNARRGQYDSAMDLVQK